MKLFFRGRQEALIPFNSYRLAAMRPTIKALFITVAAFNALLLIPDLIQITGARAVAVAALRVVYTLGVLFTLFWTIRLKTFRAYAALVTVLEAAAIAVFLIVFLLYPAPDFTIQVLGMMVIIMLVYLAPNSWANMNAVALAGIVSFFICTLLVVRGTDAGRITAGMIYLVVVSALCAIFSLHIRAYQYREYASRSDLMRDYVTDPLTRLGNRVMLEEEAAKWMDRAMKYGLPLSLIVMDVDNMKQVNDTYGHILGDAVLRQMADVLNQGMRKDDVCVRWGGDEFVLLLPYTNAREAKILAERLQDAICRHSFEPPVRLTCSFGVAPMEPGHSLDALMALADKSMYAAKKMGRNTVQVAEGPTGDGAVIRAHAQSDWSDI